MYVPPLWEHAWDENGGFWRRVWTCKADVASFIERRRIDVEVIRRMYEVLVGIRAEWEAAEFVGGRDGDAALAAAVERWKATIAGRFDRAVEELRELVAASFNAPAPDGGRPRRRRG